MYLNMSFNSALGGVVPASLSTAGIFDMQARKTGHKQTTEGCMWEPLHDTKANQHCYHTMRLRRSCNSLLD